MEELDAETGVEVTHPRYGRGVVTEYLPRFGSESDNITVQFYDLDESQTLPVYAVQMAHEVTTASIKAGRFGFTAVVDDGFGTFIIYPDGTGEGYSIEFRVNGEPMDQATVSSTDK